MKELKEINSKVKSLQKIEKALTELYKLKSSKAIAAFLEKQKCKGIPSNAVSCPIANYINKKLDNEEASIDSNRITIESYDNYDTIVELDNSRAMAEFVNDFDDGKYPKLVEVGYEIETDLY